MTEIYDYTPTLAGRPTDVLASGGQVLRLEVFPTSARIGVPTAATDSPAQNADGSWRFTFNGPAAAGRYYAQVVWTQTASSPQITDKSITLDLPIRYDLLVSIETVAVRLGLDLPVTDEQRDRIEQEIEQAQADIESYINRPVTPQFHTVNGESPIYGYDPTDYRAWPTIVDFFDDRITIMSATDTGEDGWTVEVLVGLDGRNEKVLTRYALAAAAAGIRDDPDANMGSRVITSLSAEGQSISYDKSAASSSSKGRGDTAAGSGPTLASLNRFKRAAVHRSTRRNDTPWPYRSTFSSSYTS